MAKKRNLNVPKYIGAGEGERVEQTVLKRRKRIEEVHAEKVRRGQMSKPNSKKNLRKKLHRNARDFVNNFKRREANKKELSMRQKEVERNPIPLPESAKGSIALVIRTKGDDVPVVCRKMLGKMRLKKMHDALFVDITPETLKVLNLLRDYVKWGYPSNAQIGQLLRTRGYVQNDSGQRVPLSGNTLIEEKLGEHDILCIEDIEHALINLTPSYKKVLEFLSPFRLDPPEKDESELLRRKRLRNTEMGEGTFAAYLLHCMPDLPEKVDAKEVEKISRKRALSSSLRTVKRAKKAAVARA
eukprot:Sspe_Gene.5956::Locus_1990_Transcript_2_2_Confidence_0.667_Length_996::g.5956::m.5956/K02937/RP-L7e, RPL7; large subunit ribosomal protein L7e